MPHPGNEQQSQWLTIRRAKPDYVVLRGWGVMNPVALKTAQKTGFPVDHIIGNVWSNSEEDVVPAGDAAKGYIAITTQASGAEYPVLQEIVKTVYDAGKGNLEDQKRIGCVYHNLGIVNGILNVEAVRIAQAKFGKRTLTGDEVRWGFEHLQLDPKRVEELGAKDLFHSINVTCDNHEGDGYVTFQQWDGEQVERRQRLDRPGLGAAAADHREVRGGLCGREGHHATRLREPASRAELSVRAGPHAGPASRFALTWKGTLAWPRARPCSSRVDVEATYNQSHRRSAWRQPDGAAGRDRGPARRQRRRQDDVPQGGLQPARCRTRAGDRRVDHLSTASRSVGAHRRSGRRGLVQVLEGRHCFKALTVEENLLTGAIARGMGRARRPRSELEQVYGIFPRLKVKRRVPAGLTSGGEQQMTAIGRALMAKPRLLLLDEPSMGLAPMVVEDIFNVLSDLNRTQGLSLLIAEQNAAMSLRHAQRAYVLENGMAVLEGDAAELRQRDDIKAFYLGLAPEQATRTELALAS